jgi:hypothetical protein
MFSVGLATRGDYNMNSRGIIYGIALLFSIISVASSSIGSNTTQVAQSPFRIHHLSPGQKIVVGDRLLSEWSSDFGVMEISSEKASTMQWKKLFRGAALPVGPGDISLKAYMSWDDSYWYMAVDAHDDKVLAVPASSSYPYSGDCLEVFFAGNYLDFKADFHELVARARSPEQAAFFQIDFPAVQLTDPSVYMPEWRTDANFKRQALHSGFEVSVWAHKEGWSGEARIPMSSFEPSVLSKIRGHMALKMEIVYLDYDRKIADRTQESNWGFNPENVFSLSSEEDAVNVPAYMRQVQFE